MTRIGRLGSGLGMTLVITGLGLGGCNKVSKTEHDLVLQENQALRDSLEKEKAARGEADTRNASLEQENRDFAGKLDGGRPAPGGSRADSGFRGEGVSISTRGADMVVSVAGDVLFDSGSATLKASAKKTLDNIASRIKSNYSGNKIRVEGYTDSDPLVKTKEKWQSNERLSGERALAVEQYLTSKGISKDKIYFAGFGSTAAKPSK